MSNPEQLELDLNAPKPNIIGYRVLTTAEIALMNQIKELGNEVGRLVEGMATNRTLDSRWVNIAKTDLQKGFMALVRSVAQPTGF